MKLKKISKDLKEYEKVPKDKKNNKDEEVDGNIEQLKMKKEYLIPQITIQIKI